MTVKGSLAIGMLAVAAFTGCTTGSALVARDPNKATDAAVQASPRSTSPTYDPQAGANCAENGGWYDSVAGACDDDAP
jgi:hypothetical protein